MCNVLEISIIIPTYKRKDVLFQTVASLNGGSYVPHEIIIVDQNEDDDFLVGLEKVENVIIKKCYEPSSAMARNIGLSVASNEICLFCDDDILIQNSTLFDLYKMICASNISLVAATDGLSVSSRLSLKNKISSLVSALLGMKKLHETGGYVIKSTMRGRYYVEMNSTCHTEWAMGYFFAIKKSLSISHNIWWDENLYSYAYAEDLDFSLRYCAKAKEEDLETVVTSKLGVTHLGSREYRIPTERQLFFLIANRYYLLNKNFPEIGLLRMRINNFFAGLILKKIREVVRIDSLCRRHKEMLFEGRIKELEEIIRHNSSKVTY